MSTIIFCLFCAKWLINQRKNYSKFEYSNVYHRNNFFYVTLRVVLFCEWMAGYSKYSIRSKYWRLLFFLFSLFPFALFTTYGQRKIVPLSPKKNTHISDGMEKNILLYLFLHSMDYLSWPSHFRHLCSVFFFAGQFKIQYIDIL